MIRRSALAALLLLVASGPPFDQTFSQTLSQTQGSPDKPQTFQGEIQVREIGLVVEPPASGPFKPADLLVFEAGAPRQVLKAEPLRPENGSRPWHIVLYFDRTLAGKDTTRGAALALARQAGRLTGLGTVEVAVADPEPRVEIAAMVDAAALSDTLSGIAEQARKSASPPRAAAPSPAALRRQLGRLTTFLAGRSSSAGSGARALFLVVDGFMPPPGEADLISAADTGDPAPPGTATASLRETSRTLAAGGWITFAVPFRDTAPSREQRALNDMERIRMQGGGSDHTNSAPPVIQMRGSGRGTLRHTSVAEVLTEPESAPLLALVQPTAGTVLGVDEQLRPAIDGLARRWRVWYQAPESAEGKLQPVEVRLPGSATPLRCPRWIDLRRSSS